MRLRERTRERAQEQPDHRALVTREVLRDDWDALDSGELCQKYQAIRGDLLTLIKILKLIPKFGARVRIVYGRPFQVAEGEDGLAAGLEQAEARLREIAGPGE